MMRSPERRNARSPPFLGFRRTARQEPRGFRNRCPLTLGPDPRSESVLPGAAWNRRPGVGPGRGSGRERSLPPPFLCLRPVPRDRRRLAERILQM